MIASRLIDWQRRHGRHDLPWQDTRDAYRIWLSEVMLQQTQVGTAAPYYLRFVERFPDVRALAAAGLDEVLAAWSGLGYYSRARNLHRCAREVVARHGGAFPDDPLRLAALPGIGRSTAAAIAVFAFGRRAAILDGNVRRVLCRHAGLRGHPGERAVENELWRLAEALLPDAGVESYTQGLMDLGATVCVRRRPACDACPLADDCRARREGCVAELPTPRPRRSVPTRRCAMIVVRHGERVLLERASADGLPVLGTPLPAARVIEFLRVYLTKAIARTCTMHGVLMDVLGMGVLISGESGLGKSELALELISRGHGLVADDVVELARIAPHAIEGRCPALLRDLLEVRGLGLLDIRTIFGETAVRRKMTLKLIVHLVRRSAMEDEYQRLPLEALTEDVLGLAIPKVVIPVAAGRNLAVLTEAAVRSTILQLRGFDTTGEFLARQRKLIESQA